MADNTTDNNSNLAKYMVGDRIIDDLRIRYQEDRARHFDILAPLAAANVPRSPILYIRNLPFVRPSPGTSDAVSRADQLRYKQIDEELTALSRKNADGGQAVEKGAIDTARSIVQQLSSRELAPPEVARLSSEAVVMLWALGSTRFVLTVTDGEVGYVARRAKQTIGKGANINPAEFDLLRLR